MSDDIPWVALKDVCRCYNMTLPSARNAVAADRFPVATYMLGGQIVIDKEVHAEFFRKKREEGLRKLENNKQDCSQPKEKDGRSSKT